ncbi:MAG: ribosome silencing factor [Xanthomonadales bacterium]|nr:ribosome silencing factor [Xanthomonadales bacterium]
MTTATPSTDGLSPQQVHDLVITVLEDMKAVDISIIDVKGKNSLTDEMVIASGTSSRHLSALADDLVKKAKQAGVPPLGVEGKNGSDWVLVDLNDVIVHLMLPRARLFYNLEKLWSASEAQRKES